MTAVLLEKEEVAAVEQGRRGRKRDLNCYSLPGSSPPD